MKPKLAPGLYQIRTGRTVATAPSVEAAVQLASALRSAPRFYVGLHQPSDARHFERCMVSVNRLRERKSDFVVEEWMLDSAAFTELSTHGAYRHTVADYAEQIRRWARCGQLVSATAQDYMCEPFILAKTGMDVPTHQRLTIERYDALLAEQTGAYIMPVIQGFLPREYARHVDQYGARLASGAWVGVGSVCKRNTDPAAIKAVLLAIKGARPDLRLHGFGLKQTALQSDMIRGLLHSADSMAWSYAARRDGRDANDWREARAFIDRIEHRPGLGPLFGDIAA